MSGQLEAPSPPPPPLGADGHIRGMRGGREGGIYSCTRTPSGCPTCSAAPHTTPPGGSHRGNSTTGNALWGLQGKQGTRVLRREREGAGGGEELGNLRGPAPPPPLGAIC